MGALVGQLSVVVIDGPIASGKSTIARALADRLGAAAVIDLDVVYEMLAGPAVRKDDEATWERARRVAGRLVHSFLDDGVRAVVVDGGISRRELAADALFVTLTAPYETAAARVDADPSRTFSRDKGFLARHYAQAPAPRGDLVIDTASSSIDDAVDTIVGRLSR